MDAEFLKERPEIGSNPEYKEIVSEEQLEKYIKKAFKNIDTICYRRDSKEQAQGSLMVDLLVNRVNKNKNDETFPLNEHAALINSIVRKSAKENGFGSDVFFNGFIGETASCLILNECGFTVLTPKQEEDTTGAIDMYAFDENDPENQYVLPIQVKSSTEVDKLFIHRLDGDPERLKDYMYSQNIRYLDDFVANVLKSQKKMLQYLSENKKIFGENKPIPLLVIIPTGHYSEACQFNMVTGVPSPDLVDNFWDQIEPLIFEQEAKS
jgi:hypothetical protein